MTVAPIVMAAAGLIVFGAFMWANPGDPASTPPRHAGEAGLGECQGFRHFPAGGMPTAAGLWCQ
jgi:hypothetical protein